MNFRKRLTLAAGAVSLGIASLAHAAPRTDAQGLPWDNETLEDLRSQFPELDIENDIVPILLRLEVLPDHSNVTEEDDLNDRQNSDRKTFFAVPYLQASASRPFVGQDQISKSALDIVSGVDRLARVLRLRLNRIERINSKLAQRTDVLDNYEDNLRFETDPVQIKNLEDAIAGVVAEIAGLEEDLEALESEGAATVGQLSSELRNEVVGAIQFELARVGIRASSEVRAALSSGTPTEVAAALAALRSRVALSEFGLRQVTLESGLDATQREALSAYLTVRPDVSVLPLRPKELFVRPAAQTIYNDRTGATTLVEGPIQISSINGGGDVGPCGAARSCSVVMGLTEQGARTAEVSKTNSVSLPVTFEATVNVVQPDFVGGVECTFESGWQATGRADVRDGAIIYDGDVTNRIDFADSTNEDCQLEIQQGSEEAAAYHALLAIEEQYRAIHLQRVQRAYEDRRAYERHVRAEVQRHANQSQTQRRRGLFGRVIGLFSGGGFFRGLAVGIAGLSREFYWHTRVEDTSSISTIRVEKEFNLRNLRADIRFPFDAWPVVCWHKGEFDLRTGDMVACSQELGLAPNTAADEADNNCPDDEPFGDCVADLEEEGTNGDGEVVSTPFADTLF